MKANNRHELGEQMTDKHKDLKYELNEMMVRIKVYLGYIEDNESLKIYERFKKPTISELDNLHHKIRSALNENNKPAINY